VACALHPHAEVGDGRPRAVAVLRDEDLCRREIFVGTPRPRQLAAHAAADVVDGGLRSPVVRRLTLERRATDEG
jgi:hypothetical protein